MPLRDGQLTVGSSTTNDIVLESEYVSRRHAVLRVANGGVEVEDLGSRNGTVVNGSRTRVSRAEPPSVIEFAPDARATLLAADTDEVLLFPFEPKSRSVAPAAPAVCPPEQATRPGATAPVPAAADDSLATELLLALGAAARGSTWDALLEVACRTLGWDRGLLLRIGEVPSLPTTVVATHGLLPEDGPGPLDDLRRALRAGERRGELVASTRERRGWFVGADEPTGWIAVWGEGPALDVGSRLAAVAGALALAGRLEGGPRIDASARTARRAFRLDAGDRAVVECTSSLVRELHERMAGAIQSDLNVLLVGATGVGKELYAGALHQQSARRGKPFRAINACAIPEALLESLLFGAEDGVATGVKRQKGLLREADGGTFFLDEIGEMSPGMQARLLRVIEERAVLPLGGSAPVPVDVRFVAATNRDLRAEMQAGRFREDLYQRLRGHEYRIPSLSEHPEDIPLLANAFLRDEAAKAGRDIPGVTLKAMRCFMEYHWPGNVRELESTLRRLVHELPEDGRPIGHADLPAELVGLAPTRTTRLEERLDVHRRRMVLDALTECAGNKSRAADRLGIGRVRLRELMRRLKIEDPQGADEPEDAPDDEG